MIFPGLEGKFLFASSASMSPDALTPFNCKSVSLWKLFTDRDRLASACFYSENFIILHENSNQFKST